MRSTALASRSRARPAWQARCGAGLRVRAGVVVAGPAASRFRTTWRQCATALGRRAAALSAMPRAPAQRRCAPSAGGTGLLADLDRAVASRGRCARGAHGGRESVQPPRARAVAATATISLRRRSERRVTFSAPSATWSSAASCAELRGRGWLAARTPARPADAQSGCHRELRVTRRTFGWAR
jgi:hypothetical protein